MELSELYNTVKEWLLFAEAKNVALIGFVAIYMQTIAQLISGDEIYYSWYAVCALPFLSIATLVSLFSFFPKLNLRFDWGLQGSRESQNIYFFEGIASMTLIEYRSTLALTHGLSEDRYSQDLVEQVHALALITKYKMSLFKIALTLAIVGVFTPISVIPIVILLRNEASSRAS